MRSAYPMVPEVGQIAPPLELSTWLQAPPEAALGWPIGKVVVLEYWAISCGPCVAYIPHLNKLADEFKGKPVQFIAVTDDKESVIKNFLKKTPINAWIGLGANAGLGEKTPYRVWSLPHTVIIDAQGRVAAITNPFTLTSAMIQSCLDGSLGMPVRDDLHHKQNCSYDGILDIRWRPNSRYGAWPIYNGNKAVISSNDPACVDKCNHLIATR